MKLALLFFLCFAGVSYQQRASPRFYSRSYYQPLLNLQYSNPYANKEFQPFNSYNSEFYENEGSIDSEIPVQARVPSTKNGVHSAFSPSERSNFFLPAAYLSSLFNVIPVTTITSTALTTTSVTATIASVVTCIPKAQFSTSVNGVSTTTLTTACIASRRRRSYEQMELSEESDISPSKPEQLEASAREVRDTGGNHPEIVSSQQTPQEAEGRVDYGETRQRRFLTKFSSVVTTTSTISSYSFTTTTITKSLNIAADGQLTCLPSCYSVCSP